MEKIFGTILMVFILASFANAGQKNLEQISELETKVKQIERDQINYRVEKDLLKEVYKTNYERISLMITIILGIIGILGYLGLRDINSLKKEYERELNNLKQTQALFHSKTQEFDIEKKKFDDDIKAIIRENEEQSRKIKIIELKEKINTLLKEKNVHTALEYADAALDISPLNIDILNQKGRILVRLNQIADAVTVFQRAMKSDPKNHTTMLNTAECLYLANDIKRAERLIENNEALFKSKADGYLLKFFKIIELYFKADKAALINEAISLVDTKDMKIAAKRMGGWDLEEAMLFAYYQPESNLKKILQDTLLYLDGGFSGEMLYQKLGVPKPEDKKES